MYIDLQYTFIGIARGIGVSTRYFSFLYIANVSSTSGCTSFSVLGYLNLGFLVLVLHREIAKCYFLSRPIRGDTRDIFGSASCVHRMHEIW